MPGWLLRLPMAPQSQPIDRSRRIAPAPPPQVTLLAPERVLSAATLGALRHCQAWAAPALPQQTAAPRRAAAAPAQTAAALSVERPCADSTRPCAGNPCAD